MPNDYNVVFANRAPGIYNGVTTWTSYKSKADFDKVRAERTMGEDIVAEGCTQNEAVALCSEPATAQKGINAFVLSMALAMTGPMPTDDDFNDDDLPANNDQINLRET